MGEKGSERQREVRGREGGRERARERARERERERIGWIESGKSECMEANGEEEKRSSD